MELALEAGADDVENQGDSFQVLCEPEFYADLLDALEHAAIEPTVKQITRIPNSTVDLETPTRAARCSS